MSASDVVIEASYKLPTLPSLYPGLYLGLEMRKQSDGRAYRAKLGIGSQGQITIGMSRVGSQGIETDLVRRTLPLMASSGQTINFEGYVRGSAPSTYAVRAWLSGAPTPNWQLSGQDSNADLVGPTGHIAEWTYLSRVGHMLVIQQTALQVWGEAPIPSSVIFNQTYDGLSNAAPLSLDTARLALGDLSLNLGVSNLARSSIVPVDGRGNVMRVTMPANTISEASGVIVDAKLPRSVDQASIQYDIRFDSSFDWSRGGKLPGLGGAVAGTPPSAAGGCQAGNVGAWSGRGMWITPSSYPSVTGTNELVGYMYDYNKASTCGDNERTGKALTSGTWHTVKQYYRLNTIGANGTPNSDGVYEMWLDGTLISDTENFLYRNTTNLQINYLYWEVFRGGGDMSWAGSSPGTIDFDNLIISSP